MPTDIVMPQMGESIFEGTITKWLKKPGDKVQRDEPLFEISTDKVDAEIPAPASGVLQEIKVSEGNTVQVNTVVGTIASDGDSATAAPEPSKPSAPAKPAAAAPERKEVAETKPAEPPKQKEMVEPAHEREDEHVRSSPLVRLSWRSKHRRPPPHPLLRQPHRARLRQFLCPRPLQLLHPLRSLAKSYP